ncbi:MAG: GPR endopeptidase, partial [Candidatus Contubernalis sp.]|nr:GPR endopeptidase [Candidatus Contubernalis sp.]
MADVSVENLMGLFRTDLAIEAAEMVAVRPQEEIPGVKVDRSEDNGIAVNRVSVLNQEGQKRIGKAVGNYITLEVPGLRKRDIPLQDRVSQVFTQELTNMAQFKEEMTILVVGLGNWNVTPDALGPRVVRDLLVTRHLMTLTPEVL